MVAIDERIAVAHEHREGHAHADLVRRARDRARLLDRGHRSVEAGVMGHDRARPAARRAAERGERAEIGVDRRHRREPQKPGLERLAGRAERGRRQRAAMVVRIGERGQREKPPLRGARSRDNRGDAAVREDDVDRRPGWRAVGRQEDDAGKGCARHGDRPRLTEARSAALWGRGTRQRLAAGAFSVKLMPARR